MRTEGLDSGALAAEFFIEGSGEAAVCEEAGKMRPWQARDALNNSPPIVVALIVFKWWNFTSNLSRFPPFSAAQTPGFC